MKNNPSIYVLRSSLKHFPEREACSKGDIVILSSGDLLVMTKKGWLLSPGRFISVEELKEFIKYVASGWPEDSATFLSDLGSLIKSEKFLSRTAEICELLGG